MLPEIFYLAKLYAKINLHSFYLNRVSVKSEYSSLSNNCADGINVQAGKFSKINNCADWNKDVQAGIFLEINKLCSTII